MDNLSAFLDIVSIITADLFYVFNLLFILSIEYIEPIFSQK